jgi:hypothetical protein
MECYETNEVQFSGKPRMTLYRTVKVTQPNHGQSICAPLVT